MVATLLDLRTAVRERVRLSANDPMFPDDRINRAINIAYNNVTCIEPNGWWWQHCEETVQNGVTDVDQFPVHLATPDNARLIRKVQCVFCSLDGNYWLPIPPRERTDQVRLAGGRRSSDGLPLSWNVLTAPSTIAGVKSAIALLFDPPLPAGAWVRFIANVFAADLTVDGSTLAGVPNILEDAIVENACMALIRQKRTVGVVTTRKRYATELTVTTQAAAEWVKAARIYFNTAAAGPGYSTIRARP